MFPELKIIQSSNSWILYSHFQCKTSFFHSSRTHVRPHVDKSISGLGWNLILFQLKQEMELKWNPAQTWIATMKIYSIRKMNSSVDTWPSKRKDMQLLTNQELHVFLLWRSAINWPINFTNYVNFHSSNSCLAGIKFNSISC